MRKTHYTKLLAGFLCVAVLSADLMSAGFFSLVAEATELSGTETQMAETADAQEEIFEDFSSVSETDAVIESAQMQSSEMAEMDTETEEVRSMQEETVSENAGDSETATEDLAQIEGTSENADTSETEMTETTDISESETQETETQVVLNADGNIASGVIDEDYGHITWVIDADGKLTVTGTGDFSFPEPSIYRIHPPWFEYRETIKSAKINVSGMTDASYMFGSQFSLYDDAYPNMTNIDLSDFNTSSITNMSDMFSGCEALSSLDLSNFDTSNVIDMSDMFRYCHALSSLDLSNFDTSNVTDMSGMFCWCDNLTTLNINSFNTSNVTDMSNMFCFCSNLISLNVGNFETRNVTDMNGMFLNCDIISNLNVSKFNTSNVTDMASMFDGCNNLTNLDVSKFDTGNVIDMNRMFGWCHKLDNLDVRNFDTNNVTDMACMFYSCTNLSSLDVSNFDTGKVVNMEHMFSYCHGLNSLNLSSFNMSNVSTENTFGEKTEMFDDCYNLNTIHAPLYLAETIALPVSSKDIWYQSDGTIITELPLNLSYSVVLGKNYVPDDVLSQEYKKLQLKSVIYTYGTKTVNVLKENYSIDREHGKFKLVCNKEQDSNAIKEYILYAGKSIIAISATGIFDKLNPKDLEGECLYIETKGTNTCVKTRIFLNVGIVIPKIPYSIGFLGSGLSFTVDKDVPILGGDTFKLNLPKLPINAVYEDGKIKIGFNIKKIPLYSYNSYEGVTTTRKKGNFWETEIEEIEEECRKWKHDTYKSMNILKDVKGYMEKGNLAADIPGIKGSVDFEVIGYAEADWSDSLEKIQGQLIVQITGKYTAQKQTMIWIIPVTVNCNFTASGGLVGTIGYDFINTDWYGDVTLIGKISIEPYAGVGVGTWASVGVYGMAETGVDITLLSRTDPSGLSKWYIYGESGVKGYFAKKEIGEIVLISSKKLKKTWLGEFVNNNGELLIYSNSENSLMRKNRKQYKANSAAHIYDFSSLNDAAYLEEISEWNECNEAVAYASETADNVLIANAYEAASPQTATVGDTTLLFYIDNDTSRATPNQTVLKYRIYYKATESWSAAKTAWDDGTADFNPVVYSDGTDIYVAYLNSRTEYKECDDPDMETYAGSFGVSVLRYDMDSQKIINLGIVNQNDCYCYAPRLAMSDKGLCVAWAENSDNSLFGLTDNNHIMISTLTDDGFGTPVTVANGLKSVTSLALGKNGATDSLAYAVDTDNDLTTAEQEIFMTSLSGNPVKCTEGIIDNLTFTILPGMTLPVLACSANGALSYISGTSVIELTDEGLINNADFVADGNRVLFLMNQNESRNVAAVTYDNGNWNTVMLTSEKDYVDSFTYDGTMLSYLVTKATKNDADDTWNTTSAIKTFGSIERKDIALYDVSFEPEDIKKSEKIPVTLTVCNEGSNAQSDLSVTIKKSDGSGQAQNFVLDGKFAAGEIRECTIEMMLPDSIDSSCMYTVTLDADETETNIENNSFQLDMTLTDISVSTAYLMETQKDADTDTESHVPVFEVTAANDSYVAADGFVIIKNQDGDTIFTSQAETIAAKDKKLYRVDLTDYLPADGSAVLLTAEFVTDAEEYYKSDNYDDKSVYKIENTKTEIEEITKGVTVTEFKESGYEYTGSPVKPSIYVYNNGELLEEVKDYTISYENNVNVYDYQEGDGGFDTEQSPKAVVSFIGETAGNDAVTKYFKIVPKDIGGNDTSCSVFESDENGTVQHPDVRLSVNGTTLIKDVDYTLTYPDEGTDAYKVDGIYNILIEGTGNYCGTRYAAFTIRHKHSWDNGYLKDGAGHWQVCACEETTNKENHTFGDWATVKEASEAESGAKERACSVCGYKHIEIIKISSTGSPENPSEDESSVEESSESESSESESSESASSESESSTENPSEDESIWGDIIPEDRPASPDNIPKGLWVGGLNESYIYIGEAVRPDVRVYDSATLLKEKAEYTIAYKNNVKVGEATITVNGKGNYSGKETCSFRILAADISDDAFYAENIYVKIDAKKVQKPIPELYYMGTKLQNNKDFTIAYSNKSGIYAKKGEYTVTLTGKNNFTGKKPLTLTAVSQIPKKTPVSITKATLTGFKNSFPYTGKACSQTCTLTIQTSSGKKELAEGVDYTVRYANNIKAGTATVLYYGKNGYTGKLKKTYKILPYDITADSAKKLSYDKKIQCVYAKGGAKPKPAITFDGKALREGADYTLSYQNNKTIGTGSSPCVTINGKGSFKGKIKINFTIKPQDLSKMTLVSCDKMYSGKPGAHKLTPKLMDLDGKLLSAGKDFDKNSITYAYDKDTKLANGTLKKAGAPVADTDTLPADTQIRITLKHGSGNGYTGIFEGTFRIVKADIKSAKVEIPTQIYTGDAIVPDKKQIKVTLAGKRLRDEDYDIVLCTDNVKKGKASITLKGKGNYGGTKTVKFTIGAKGFLWWWRKK